MRTLTFSRSLGQVFVGCHSIGIGCFSHDETKVIGYGEENHRSKYRFYHNISGAPTINMIDDYYADLDHLAEVVFLLVFCTGKLFSPLSILFSLEGSYPVGHLKIGELFEGEVVHTLFGILLHGRRLFSPPFTLFNHLFYQY